MACSGTALPTAVGFVAVYVSSCVPDHLASMTEVGVKCSKKQIPSEIGNFCNTDHYFYQQ
jgi:hypothetical protein